MTLKDYMAGLSQDDQLRRLDNAITAVLGSIPSETLKTLAVPEWLSKAITDKCTNLALQWTGLPVEDGLNLSVGHEVGQSTEERIRRACRTIAECVNEQTLMEEGMLQPLYATDKDVRPEYFIRFMDLDEVIRSQIAVIEGFGVSRNAVESAYEAQLTDSLSMVDPEAMSKELIQIAVELDQIHQELSSRWL